jgi:2-succinyl-5-enolpyruvyl-6-hydroxy-3-cyclohexene-1-carboxylate synthase
MFGLSHVRPETPAELEAVLRRWQADGHTGLVEVRANREETVRIHAEAADAAGRALAVEGGAL